MRSGSAFLHPAVSLAALPRGAVAATPILRCQSGKSWGGSVNLRASRRTWLLRALPITAAAAVVAGGLIAIAPSASAAVSFQVESLDGGGNNVNNPTWGQAGRAYLRVGTAHYADGISQPINGPSARFISNRVINDRGQDIFSERRVTQWGWAWGQFLDHTFGLRDGAGPTATAFNIPFSATDPLETFTNNLGTIPMNRSAATAGTGTSTANPRQQTNTITSYLEAQNVYSSSATRLDWLRAGPVDGNPANNQANLLMSPNNYLPKASQRGNAATAPAADTDGRLASHPQDRRIAGDPRANETLSLTANHTLFAREHNRIVSLLPSSLSQEDKFQIARRVVAAEEQYITYQEWLPAMGVALPRYTGYKNNVNATLSNEFAAVGYRVHSQIHGEFEADFAAGEFTDAQLNTFRAEGVEVNGTAAAGGELAIPTSVSFFFPELLEQLGVGKMALLLGDEPQYNNDEEIDDQLRSVLFQIPTSINQDCISDPAADSSCFNVVNDLGAIDVQRGRDHGTGSYNQLRQAYGLPTRSTFKDITGASTEEFPAGSNINNPNQLDVQQLFDIDGNSLVPGSEAGNTTAVFDVRRSTVAARLKAIYGGNVNAVDGFVGVIAEPHVPGTEFGELQLAIWTKQFQALRDGDRFFFENDLGTLNNIKSTYGIDFRTTLGQLIARNTDAATAAAVHDNVFLVAEDDLPAPTCSIDYRIFSVDATHFGAVITATNNTNQTIFDWTLRYQYAQGQSLQIVSGAIFTQSGGNTFGRDVTATAVGGNEVIQPHTSEDIAVIRAAFDGNLNAIPPNFTLNNKRCASNHH
jgi:hypothetical protein